MDIQTKKITYKTKHTWEGGRLAPDPVRVMSLRPMLGVEYFKKE